MSASNLFDDIEGDDDIFYTPAKTPPKKKKQWMDDLLDDDKDLFGDIKADNKDSSEPASAVAPSMEKKEGETTKPKSGGGLFDDLPLDDEDKPLSKSEGQASNINGHKDEDFVLVSHNEVPSAEEAERTANPAPATDTTEAEHDGPNSDLFNQNVGYEERARLRREQRRKRAEEKERNSKTPSPTSQSGDTSEDRDKRSTTPSPSPGIVETSQELPESRKSQSPVAELSVEPQEEKVESLTPTPEPTPQQKDDPSEEIWQLTKSLERAQAENGYLKSENEQLTGEVKTLQDKVAKLEKELADRTKKEDEDSAANKKQVADLQEKLKSKDKEIEDLKAALKKTASPHHGPVTTVVSLKKAPHSPAQSPRTKLRAGVDKGRPITSVADSVKKFSGAGTTEVKRTPVPAKPKQSSPAHVKPDDKHSPAKKPSATPHPKPSPPAKPRVPTHHDKPELHPSKHHAHSHTHQAHPPKDHAHSHGHHPHSHHPHPHHPHHPHKPEPSSKSVKVTHKKPQHTHHTHAHHTTDKKESAKQEKMEEEKKTEEVTITKEEPKPEPEPVAPPAEPEPPSEPKSEAPAAEVKPSEKKEEETTIQQLEKDTTRAQRVISLFENKGNNKPEEEQAPVWKVSAQQQRAAKDKEEREKEAARQKEQEQQQEEEKEKAEAEKSRTSSNASSQKDEPVVVNGSVESTTAESANDEKESTDGGMISKARGLVSSSSNVTKSTSALPPATKNTSNKNDEIKIRDNKMKKAGSSTTTIANPKKRLMVEETKGKRSSWAAPKREECAVCEKVVYVMERLEADKVVYHKTCFKCTVCNKTLSTGTYAALQGKIYCKVHFKQLFKMKGNYDEGFGREQHKTKWIKKDQLDGESEA